MKEESNIDANLDPNLMEGFAEREEGSEASLRGYALVLAGWWREILLGAFLTAIAGAASVTVLQRVAPKYEASASAMFWPVTSRTNLDRKFESIRSQDRSTFRETAAQRNSLIPLVHHDEVARKVAERLSGMLGEDPYTPFELIGMITAKRPPTSSNDRTSTNNVVNITATTSSPDTAAAIVNVWVEEYVAEVNKLFEQAPSYLIGRITAEKQVVEKRYEEIQRVLEKSISESRSDELKRRILNNKKEVKILEGYRQEIADSLFNEELDAQFKWIGDYHKIRRRLVELLNDAESILIYVEEGGEAAAASNGLTIQLFKIRALAEMTGAMRTTQVSLDAPAARYTSSAEQVAEMSAVIASLEDRIERLDRTYAHQIGGLPGISPKTAIRGGNGLSIHPSRGPGLPGGADSPAEPRLPPPAPGAAGGGFGGEERSIASYIAELDEENRLLEMKLESEQFVRDNLLRERKLTRGILQTLTNEEQELKLAFVVGSSVLRIASRALIPRTSAWPSPILAGAASGAAALPFAVFVAFFMNSLGIRPFLGNRSSGG